MEQVLGLNPIPVPPLHQPRLLHQADARPLAKDPQDRDDALLGLRQGQPLLAAPRRLQRRQIKRHRRPARQGRQGLQQDCQRGDRRPVLECGQGQDLWRRQG